MSRKQIEKMIPDAMRVLSEEFPNGQIPSSYNGYISAFGASIVQSGLKPTLAVYENMNASSKEDKTVLTKLIVRIIAPEYRESLLNYVLDEGEAREQLLRDKIVDAAVAIKLSIRTFKLV